jgi:quercetin dioxygenase-like cupin family protein
MTCALTDEEAPMSHTTIDDPAAAIQIQPGAVVSKVLHRGDGLDVTIFGFDAGEGLTEHIAARGAIVQIVSGRMRFVVDGDTYDAGPGWWLYMAPGTAHALEATEPTVMLLTLLPA